MLGSWIQEVRIDSEARPSVTSGEFSDQPPQVESSQQSDSDGEQSQQERTLIDEGAFTKERSCNNDLQNYQLTRDWPQRVRHAPMRYGYVDLVVYALTHAADNIEAKPFTFEEAIALVSKEQWKDVM
ncbi:unnamed protein product [Citrullus colocynthis]|uniref:Uncharacterized protein n=1 Tax=Citrullus colocynthis TaxID=252529 RepID=A0ABP0Z5B3_9ROSI